MPQQILIAEDDTVLRAYLVAALDQPQYEVVQAADGAEVLTRLAWPPPALVLMDLHMPVMHGLDTLRRLRAVPAWATTPVLFLTASDRTEDMIEARQLGARGYLVKPILPTVLIDTVAQVLADRNLIWLDDMTRLRRNR